MTPQQRRQRLAELLLPELKAGELNWHYISIIGVSDGNKFRGGCLIRGFGPTDAWRTMHSLNICPPDCETQTFPEVPNESMSKIPESMLWRLLTEEEIKEMERILES